MFLKNYGMSLFGGEEVDGKGHRERERKMLFMGDFLNGCSIMRK